MIKKECQLVPVPRSLKEYKAGVLVKNKTTNQFGTIRREALRGKFARRNLRNSFNEIKLCLTFDDSIGNIQICLTEEVLFTLKDGNLYIGEPMDIMGDQIVKVDPILLSHKEIMMAWVYLPAATTPVKFHQLTPKIVQDILDNGGRVWIETRENASGRIPKLIDNHPIIHLQP